MNTLLLVFFDPRKFVNLLGGNTEIRKRIELGDEETGPIFNNEEVIYLTAGERPVVGAFDSEKVNTALAVLIPDSHKRIEEYTPNKPFKILHHTTGQVQNLRVDLLTHEFFKAVSRETEDPYTSYDKVAAAIVDAEKGDSLDGSLKAIYEAIEEPDYVLEAKLLLLHIIINEDGTSLAGVIKILTDDQPDKVKRVFDAVIKTDPMLGDKVLRAKEFHCGKEVTVEGKLNSLRDEFVILKQVNLDDVFSTEYQIAFDKLREALGIG